MQIHEKALRFVKREVYWMSTTIQILSYQVHPKCLMTKLCLGLLTGLAHSQSTYVALDVTEGRSEMENSGGSISAARKNDETDETLIENA